MSDLNPIILLSILSELLGSLAWPFLVLALIVGLIILLSALKLRREGRVQRSLAFAVSAWGIASCVILPFLPAWTEAGFDALNGPLDLFTAFLIALAPGSLAGVAVFAALSFVRPKVGPAGAGGPAPARH